MADEPHSPELLDPSTADKMMKDTIAFDLIMVEFDLRDVPLMYDFTN